jgi:hypothetical protein
VARGMKHLRKRLALLLAVVLLVGTTVGQETHLASAAATTAVSWTVDHNAKTITVTANIAFYVVPPADTPYKQQRFEATVERAQDAIEDAWNDHSFKCYELIVIVNARAAKAKSDVHDNEVPVKFDPAVFPSKEKPLHVDRTRSYVTAASGTDDYLSDNPQFTPTTGSHGRASTWAFEAPDGEFAHEFGHILGLSDNYVEGAWVLKPGAADDLMNTSGDPISDATITKAVRRSGQVDEKSIKCPLKIDLATSTIGLPGFAGGTIGLQGCAPDYDPESTDVSRPAKATFHGKVAVTGDANSAIPVLGSATVDGSLDFQATWTWPSTTVAIDVGGGEQIVQDVKSTGQGPVSEPQRASLMAGTTDLGLGVVMTITEYDGPCE